MAEELSYEESDYDSDHIDSRGSSNESELSLSCEFSSFEGGSSKSEAAEGEAVEGLSDIQIKLQPSLPIYQIYRFPHLS